MGNNAGKCKLTKISDKTRFLVKGLSEILEEAGIVFSGHGDVKFGNAVAVVLGVAEIDLAQGHGVGHLVICFADEMVW
jgi:hypothetical protein